MPGEPAGAGFGAEYSMWCARIDKDPFTRGERQLRAVDVSLALPSRTTTHSSCGCRYSNESGKAELMISSMTTFCTRTSRGTLRPPRVTLVTRVILVGAFASFVQPAPTRSG